MFSRVVTEIGLQARSLSLTSDLPLLNYETQLIEAYEVYRLLQMSFISANISLPDKPFKRKWIQYPLVVTTIPLKYKQNEGTLSKKT